MDLLLAVPGLMQTTINLIFVQPSIFHSHI